MKNTRKASVVRTTDVKWITMILVVMMLISTELVGCSDSAMYEESLNKSHESQISMEIDKYQNNTTEVETKDESSEEIESSSELNETQKNSIAMMNYLAIAAERICTAKNRRLILEEIYTGLLNELNPGAIDENTQKYLADLRNVLKTLMNIQTKRERIEYLYNQDKAAMIRRTILPNVSSVKLSIPLADWNALAVSLDMNVAATYDKYKSAVEDLEREYLLSGWDFDDAELKIIQNSKETTFEYMIDMIQDSNLSKDEKTAFGKMTLKDKDIEQFVKMSAIEDVYQKKDSVRSGKAYI